MNVARENARMDTVQTLPVVSHVSVLQDLMFLPMEQDVLIMMNAPKSECVLMESVSTWTGVLNATVNQDTNFLRLDMPA